MLTSFLSWLMDSKELFKQIYLTILGISDSYVLVSEGSVLQKTVIS